MKVLGFLTAVSLILSSFSANALEDNGDGRFTRAPVQIERYEIAGDGGGSVKEFQEALRYFKNSGKGIKIDGYCASACTLVMSSDYKLDVCVTKKASLMIHHPYMVQYGPLGFEIVKTIPAIYGAEKLWDEEFYKKYPKWIKTEIDKNGGAPSVYTGKQPSDMFVIGFDVLKNFLTVCGD